MSLPTADHRVNLSDQHKVNTAPPSNCVEFIDSAYKSTINKLPSNSIHGWAICTFVMHMKLGQFYFTHMDIPQPVQKEVHAYSARSATCVLRTLLKFSAEFQQYSLDLTTHGSLQTMNIWPKTVPPSAMGLSILVGARTREQDRSQETCIHKLIMQLPPFHTISWNWAEPSRSRSSVSSKPLPSLHVFTTVYRLTWFPKNKLAE